MRDIHDGDDISGLILRVSLRDRAAFDRLYQATGPKLFGTCLRILRNKAEAEEAVQEVFVKIWLKADRFSVTGQSPMSWLIAIARNQAIDRLRMRRDVTGGIDDAALEIRDPAPTPEARSIARAERRQLDGCLSQLDGDRAAGGLQSLRGVDVVVEPTRHLDAEGRRHGVLGESAANHRGVAVRVRKGREVTDLLT